MTTHGTTNPDNKPNFGIYLASRAFDLCENIVRYGSIPFFFWLCVRELAGHETVVNVVVNYFAKGGNLLPWGLAGGASIWAYGERRLRQTKTKRMSKHLEELEKRLDPNRSSSGLTVTGQTPRRG